MGRPESEATKQKNFRGEQLEEKKDWVNFLDPLISYPKSKLMMFQTEHAAKIIFSPFRMIVGGAVQIILVGIVAILYAKNKPEWTELGKEKDDASTLDGKFKYGLFACCEDEPSTKISC